MHSGSSSSSSSRLLLSARHCYARTCRPSGIQTRQNAREVPPIGRRFRRTRATFALPLHRSTAGVVVVMATVRHQTAICSPPARRMPKSTYSY